MRLNKHLPLAFLCFAAILSSAAVSLCADDPLNTFPTAEEPVEDRVRRLTEADLKAIQLPENGEQLVLSVSLGPNMDDEKEEAKPIQRLRVFADGRLECHTSIPQAPSQFTEGRKDRLTHTELKWLLHLAVNECHILSRTSKDIADAFGERGKQDFRRGLPRQYFHYHIAIPAGTNDLLLPEEVLTVRPLRSRMKLGAFASLNKYATFLIYRAYLGDVTERDRLLEQLNNKLQLEDPKLPPFRMEHLVLANDATGIVMFKGAKLSAMFWQDVEIAPKKFLRVIANVSRQQESDVPTFKFITMKRQI